MPKPEPEFDIHAWVRASRARQGLPPRIEDPVVVAEVAAWLAEAGVPPPAGELPPAPAPELPKIKPKVRRTYRRHGS